MKRRSFVKGIASSGLGLVASSTFVMAAKNKATKLVILHTNDVHSQIEPFPKNHPRFGGMGGFARRATLVQKIRNEEENVLLLDAGDFFQGTPYFNFFKGEVEVKLMNKLHYDASTLGNHEFDNGVGPLYNAIKDADFDILVANYAFEDSRWNDLVKPYKIYQKGKVKAGVIGLGINPKGLIDERNFTGVTFSDPLPVLNRLAKELRDQGCNVVIALTHLGIDHDRLLAKNCEGVDLILGGHSHTFLEEPEVYINPLGKTVLLNQVGKSGIYLGRIDLYLGNDTEQVNVGQVTPLK